ncbi:HvfC/BufC N-terminal domain-containing protein [Pseudoprimorskyibacter insulae]|uniref:Putative DNA-binding domain-containing protein n=1 Tax=Pseudoprimorskyibacter insulae TaxID=1695997 RepID=A0A2R8AQP1_9RHOB|nr:DNA-binding domain-containing protein [Pseudoprimorskyibacter insulae]SPF78391.1 hypothetical protein PRI8871_00993 [Pseudoprimorskyibacter insulae]
MTGQSEFHAALLQADQPVPSGLTDGQGRPAGRRFAVYRNNVAVSLTEALETGFPAIRALLGEENFRAIAGLYLRESPPTSPVLSLYGAGFPEFLANHPPLAHLGYLPDVAQLELALRQSYHAADSTPIDPATFQRLTEDNLSKARLRLAPALRLVRSPWPVVDLWRYATRPGSKHPSATPQDALILRPAFDPEPHELPAHGASFLAALAKGLPVAQAIEAAGDDHDLAATLTLLLQGGGITAIDLE